jgi:hypothetical protein
VRGANDHRPPVDVQEALKHATATAHHAVRSTAGKREGRTRLQLDAGLAGCGADHGERFSRAERTA